MNNSEKLLNTLNFQKSEEGGAVLETFYPWTLTVDRWVTEGLNPDFSSSALYPSPELSYRRYFNDLMTEPVYAYEQALGFDGVKRMSFRIPFKSFEKEILKEDEESITQRDEDGWIRIYYKNRPLIKDLTPIVSDEESWIALKNRVLEVLSRECTDENLEKVYAKYAEGHKKGEFSIRFRASGFFWTPRELMGDEEHLISFYEEPELLHEINSFILEQYKLYLGKIFDLIQPEVILFEEDLSGKNGPMISPAMFNEFMAPYYKELIPYLKQKGVKNVFVDTDGDFRQLIPHFLACGVDGFLPMDVNAGMNIVEVRKEFPTVKFIGAFNKLVIDQGKEAIDQEFERLLPVIRQGGYVPGADHQVAPSASFENYQYYISKLKEVMKQACADA